MDRFRYLFLAAAVVLLAFLLREWYVIAAQVAEPIRGDSSDYMRYAYNLVHHGTFSNTQPGLPVVADAYRGPGYPLFLAAIMSAFPGFTEWLNATYQAQAVVGALTVAGTIALARQGMSRGASLGAGLLLAVWPHHVAATGSVLSEVLFGLVIVGALICATLALNRKSLGWGVAAGAVFGFGYLVNPLIILLPVAALPLFWRLPKVGAAMVAVSLLAVGSWGLRDVAPTPSRASINIVQGSWPEYHESVRWRHMLAVARADDAAINAEVEQVAREGFGPVAVRLASDPVKYAKWYAQKPYELWGWDIQQGAGGIYFLYVDGSPLEGALAPLKIGAWLLNPALFALALLGLWRWRDNPMVALAFVYLTALHVVFQAEPRYAIAYRSMEMILAVGGLSMLLGAYRLKVRHTPTTQPVCPVTGSAVVHAVPSSEY